jgi:hypothetical protein
VSEVIWTTVRIRSVLGVGREPGVAVHEATLPSPTQDRRTTEKDGGGQDQMVAHWVTVTAHPLHPARVSSGITLCSRLGDLSREKADVCGCRMHG